MIRPPLTSGPERIVAARIAAIRRRSGVPAAKRALFRIVRRTEALTDTRNGTRALTPDEKRARAHAEMDALRIRLNRSR